MLEKALRWIVYACVFALPFICLIVAGSMFFPFITGKNFSFRIIVEIMTGAWLILALVYEKYRPRRSSIVAALAIFVVIIALADAFGAYPFKSFWSNYERMDGWVTLIHVFLYVLVASSVIMSERVWRSLMQLNLAVSVFVSLYGFSQVFGYTALGQGGQSGLGARIDASFGNPIYMAVYMLFNIFMAALLWVQMWQVKPPGKRLLPSLMYGAVIGIDTFALFFTGTRGTMLGLIGGATLAILILAFFEGTRRTRVIALATIVGLVVVGSALHFGRESAFVKRVGFLERLATISVSDSTIKSRFLNAGIAWQGVKERPILGWGQENYAIVFDKYYDPRMYGQEPWFDRVHDIIFDWLIAGGFLGLISYLSIFGAALWATWFRGAFTFRERAILTGLLGGYFVHNLTVFDNITSYILFGTILGYIIWREQDARKSPSVPQGRFIPERALPFVAIAVIIVTWTSAWLTNAHALAANKTLLLALAYQPEGPTKNLEYFREVIDYGSFGTQEAREQLAQIAAALASQDAPSDLKQEFKNYADSQMQVQEAASPLDARFPLFRGVLLDAFGDYKAAAGALEQAHKLSPGKQQIIYEQAANAIAQNDINAALNFYKEAFELYEDNWQAREMYAALLIQSGNDALADEVLAPKIEDGTAATPRITGAYLARKRYDKIVEIWSQYVNIHPDNVQGYYTLAAAYYSMGNKNDAISALENAIEASSSVRGEAQSLIEQIRNGTAQVQ